MALQACNPTTWKVKAGRLNIAWKTRGCVKVSDKEEGKCGLGRFGSGKQGKKKEAL